MGKSSTPAIEDETCYSVALKRVVKRGRVTLRPGEEVILKGKVVKEIADDIAEYRPVAS